MHHYRLELWMMGGSQRVGVVDASTSVGVGVGKNDDVFVRNTCQPVVDAFYPTGGEVSVRIERAEMGTDGCRLPFVFQRDTDSTVG